MWTNPKKKMTARVMWVVAAAGLASIVVACEGGGAGAKCSKNSDCNTSLTCQPIEGRNADYCCGTYGPDEPSESIPENCQPLVAGNPGSGSGSGESEDAAGGG